jgi:hypothetical protein
VTFKPGYKRRKRTYSFRAWVDKEGWNVDRKHAAHQRRTDTYTRTCDCLKLWDLNWRGSSHNIIRVTRGRRHLVILLGRKYRRIRIMGGKR